MGRGEKGDDHGEARNVHRGAEVVREEGGSGALTGAIQLRAAAAP